MNDEHVNEKTDKELELLLNQREVIVEAIKTNIDNMVKIIVAVVPVLITILLTYIFSFDKNPLIRIIGVEMLIILILTVSAFLFNANIYRDYICAIDKYLREKYKIYSLIFEGELSRKHVTGFLGVFPMTTNLIGWSAAVLVGFTISIIIYSDWGYYYAHHIYFFLIGLLGLQVVLFIFILAANIFRKTGRNTKILDDCYEYIGGKNSDNKQNRMKFSRIQQNRQRSNLPRKKM